MFKTVIALALILAADASKFHFQYDPSTTTACGTEEDRCGPEDWGKLPGAAACAGGPSSFQNPFAVHSKDAVTSNLTRPDFDVVGGGCFMWMQGANDHSFEVYFEVKATWSRICIFLFNFFLIFDRRLAATNWVWHLMGKATSWSGYTFTPPQSILWMASNILPRFILFTNQPTKVFLLLVPCLMYKNRTASLPILPCWMLFGKDQRLPFIIWLTWLTLRRWTHVWLFFYDIWCFYVLDNLLLFDFS